MPIYEFYCPDCHRIFNFFSRQVNTRKRPKCPRCGRPRLSRQVSIFAISRGRSEPEDAGLPDLDPQQLERAMASLASEAEGLKDDDPRQMGRLLRKVYEATGLGLGSGLEEAVSRLEAGEDPDSAMRKEGEERFRQRLREAPHYFDFLRGLVVGRGDRPEEKERAVRSALETLTAFGDDDLHLKTLLERLSESFGVEMPVLRRALGEIRRTPSGGAAGKEARLEIAETGEEDGKPEEKALLALLLSEGQGREMVLELLDAGDFADPRLSRIFGTLKHLGRVPTVEDLGRLFPDPGTSRLVHELSFLEVSRQGAWVRPAALRLKLAGLLERNRDFQGRVEALELAGDGLPAELLEEWRHLGERIRTLRKELDQSLKQEGA